jgi:hypothetical protein
MEVDVEAGNEEVKGAVPGWENIVGGEGLFTRTVKYGRCG